MNIIRFSQIYLKRVWKLNASDVYIKANIVLMSKNIKKG